MNHSEREFTAKVLFVKRYESGWTRITTSGERQLVGETGEGDLRTGQTYQFEGFWKEHPSYGWQFQVTSYAQVRPVDRDGVMAYLQQRTGLGPATAARIWDEWGQRSLEEAAKNPDRLAELGVRDPEATAQWLKSNEQKRESQAKLQSLFKGMGMPKGLIPKLLEDHGLGAEDKIRKDPFAVLLDYERVGFKRADAVWQKLGKPRHDILRGRWCAWYGIHNRQDGSVWYRAQDVTSTIMQVLQTEKLRVIDCIEAAEDAGIMVSRRDDKGTTWYASTSEAAKERELARLVVFHCHGQARESGFAKTMWPDVGDILGLSDHQAEQLDIALQNPVGILTGGPGTGKTYTVAQLVKALLKAKHNVRISAPTGKAAVRCKEALRLAGVDVETSTHHKALDWGFQGPRRDHTNPIDEVVHILDEQSMPDNGIMSKYLRACKPGSNLLFVLDQYQLPPVGRGCPALDMIRHGVPVGQLTQPRRNSGQIVQCCQDIRNGRGFSTSRAVNVDAGENLFMTETATPEACIKAIGDWIELAKQNGYHPIEDVQVICPRRDRSQLSCQDLNPMLQQMLNPGGKPVGVTKKYREGDKVLCLKNGMYGTTTKTSEYVANGEQGIVLGSRDEKGTWLLVEFQGPLRICAFPVKSDEIDLAYAVTCHKAQGSEWPVTLTVFDPSYFAGSLEWVTTGISRAKQLCIGIGLTKTAEKWCRNTSLHGRKTFAREEMDRELTSLYLGAGK